MLPLCRDGGIGRRTGLKIQRGQLHGGSIPPPGTRPSSHMKSVRMRAKFCRNGRYYTSSHCQKFPSRYSPIFPIARYDGIYSRLPACTPDFFMLVCSQLHRVVPPKFRNVSAAHQEAAYRGENAVASSVSIYASSARSHAALPAGHAYGQSCGLASFSQASFYFNNNKLHCFVGGARVSLRVLRQVHKS